MDLVDMDVTPSAFRLRTSRPLSLLMLGLSAFSTVGCQSTHEVLPNLGPGPHDTTASYHDHVGLEIEYPDVKEAASAPRDAAMATEAPLAFADPASLPTFELTLDEAIEMAVGQSPVIRSLGGSIGGSFGGGVGGVGGVGGGAVVAGGVSQSAFGATTVYDPALTYANPLGGVEAALSEFDAQVSGQLLGGKTDSPNNSQAALFFQPSVTQTDSLNFASQISKTTATGGRFALRHIVNYSSSNQPFLAFPSSFTGWVEAEWRQPLMQGAGATYNRIAGPNSVIGQYNGVLIARINNDISLNDFEAAVITLVADVEQAYWNLYGGYRTLEAQLRGREAALQTFQYQETRLRVGAGSADEEAQARSQYFQFAAQVENALAGSNGLYPREQRLRYLLGLPATDGRLIRPVSEPQDARVVFDWQSALAQALERRVEVRRQMWNVKRRELELIAARLNRRPQLDFLGTYRWRGLGDDLIGNGNGPFDNLYDSIGGGNYQEWTAGFELNMPVGLRRASVAVSSAQLNLARDRAILAETELTVSHDLSDAARELSRAYRLLQINFNRWSADQQQVEVLRERYESGRDNINFLLQAQRSLVTSETDFYGSLVDYNLAIRNLHRQKGSLLAYNQVQLAEGPWASKAYSDAYEMGRFFTPRAHPERVQMPRPLGRSGFDPSAPVSTQGATLPPPEANALEPESGLQPESPPQPASAL